MARSFSMKLRRYVPYSLKNRLRIVLLLSSLTPLILIGYISYSSLYSILVNKAERGVKSNLHQVLMSLENTLSQLNHASQQLAFDGRVGKNLEGYLTAGIYEKKRLYDDIVKELSLINFTNPTLGLTFYYFADNGQILFENYRVSEFDTEKLPLLEKYGKITYFGPHKSLNPIDGHQVLSIMRSVDLPERDDAYVYIETNFKLAENIIKNDQFDGSAYHLIVDSKGRIAFSENEADFPVGSRYAMSGTFPVVSGGYYMFEEESNQKWKVVAAIPKASYEQEIDRWVKQFAFFTVLSLAVSFLFAWVIWNTVYKPLRLLSQDIRDVKNHILQSPARFSRILEFDVIHQEFETMRLRISELIQEIEQKEKGKAQVEIEKLMHQINPHFIYNTLDTIRWLARANGQKDIDRLVSTLNKVLHYNLGKGGPASIGEEIEALKNYVMLQGIRYNFEFDVNISADPEALKIPIPRFILQPLVENSLYHGLAENGSIRVHVIQDGGSHVLLTVQDDGYGMTEEEVRSLLGESSDGRRKIGMGIGLSYVQRMIRFQFGDEADLRIESEVGKGTTIVLRLPIIREGDVAKHA
ncbi:cache domain-containing sensor histidine kinase [Paenibacillus hamazuiensis]|uniref:cache domain-containing sensor histidine kinase n=1 Tax=Paenibacillus hamazuiensis TaxID=2936508 RepID=UPI00200DCC8E|nr:histidine kinase [Paenibacillus hamazuiensis]